MRSGDVRNFNRIRRCSRKIRIFILTDIENEPDDAVSMVRSLTYSNQFDVESLVATTSIFKITKIDKLGTGEFPIFSQVDDFFERELLHRDLVGKFS